MVDPDMRHSKYRHCNKLQALARAAVNNNMELAVVLWKAGASLEDGDTSPLVAASLKGRLGMLRLLLALGADIDARQRTPDQAADAEGSMTAFHAACAGCGDDHADCVEVLVLAGCDVTAKNRHGKTGKEIAMQKQRHRPVAAQSVRARPGQ